MVLPILLFAAAGALAGGGLGGGWYLWQKATGAAAADLSQDQIKHLTQLLKDHRSLQALKEEAAEAGVDVEAVVAGYEAMRARQLSAEEVARLLIEGKVPIPTSVRNPPISRQLLTTYEASNSDIRQWARANGLKIADRGPIPGAVLTAYAEGHSDQ